MAGYKLSFNSIYTRDFASTRNIINVSLKNFINSYIFEKHMVEEALKERHLIAKGVSPGYKDVI